MLLLFVDVFVVVCYFLLFAVGCLVNAAGCCCLLPVVVWCCLLLFVRCSLFVVRCPLSVIARRCMCFACCFVVVRSSLVVPRYLKFVCL